MRGERLGRGLAIPQGDIVHDRIAAHKFKQAVRHYVLARLQEEWHGSPRSIMACVSYAAGFAKIFMPHCYCGQQMLPSGYVASSNDLLPGLRGLFTYHFQLRNGHLQRLLTVLAQISKTR